MLQKAKTRSWSRTLPDWRPADLAAALAPRPVAILDGLMMGSDRCTLVAWDLGPPLSVGRALAAASGHITSAAASRSGAASGFDPPAALGAAIGAINWDGTEWFCLPGSAALFSPAAGRLWVRGELPPGVTVRTAPPAPVTSAPEVRPLWSRAGYVAAVREAQRRMEAGALQKVILSVPFEVGCHLPAHEVYERLRAGADASFAFLLPHGQNGWLVGRSPEPLVRLAGRRAEMRLLAGTRRDQGKGQDGDLLASRKDQQEHLIAVEQAQRDLMTVCSAGSVAVDACMELERHPGLIHLSSRLSGLLREDATAADLIRACFPASTVGGVPRDEAVALIDRLEPVPRDWYAGAVGALLPDGGVQLWLTIRSLHLQDGTARLRTGAGLVKESVPEAEWQECVGKVRPTAAAIGAEVADDVTG